MGEGTVGMNGTSPDAKASAMSPRQTAQQLETEIEALRDELEPLVAEVDRRRHELLDVKLQLRRHAWQIALAGAGVIAVTASLVWLGVRRAPRRPSLLSRASRLREGVARMIDRPERVAADRTLAGKMLTAAATAALSATAKKAVERLVKNALNWDSRPGANQRRPHGDWPKAA